MFKTPERIDPSRPGPRPTLAERAGWELDRLLSWHRLPKIFGLARLVAIRARLQRKNLFDAKSSPCVAGEIPPPPWRPENAVTRSADGTYNDLDAPRMGATGARFGRNVSPQEVTSAGQSALLDPNPRDVSRRLLTRREFVPSPHLNLLSAAWVQFEVHDWFSHGDADRQHLYHIPLQSDDPWPERPMTIGRTPPATARAGAAGPPTYANRVTHWWDASQLYGSDQATLARLRSGRDGKLTLTERGELPFDPVRGLPLTGFRENWWLGLTLLHTLFAREHNAICDRLRDEYSTWTDDQLFGRARLINAALIAKIHTVEWAAAILGHPTMKHALKDTWWGFAGERARRSFGRLGEGALLSGLPGSPRDHHDVPYAITEEFVAVYRMHPLLPDEVRLRSAASGESHGVYELRELVGRTAADVAARFSAEDLFYSFGATRAGALSLHNYPRALQGHRREDGTLTDVAAVDILRDRERGVPRYNALRRALGLSPVETFEELCDDAATAAEIRQLYKGDIDSVDLLVGLLAERPPPGFSLSETAFRIFLLMASRRLQSDRFFTTDYTPEIYTPAGLDWVDENNMSTVLLRHHPDLAGPLRHVENPFNPWPVAPR